MTYTFERIHHKDSSRELGGDRESQSIELSDQQYLALLNGAKLCIIDETCEKPTVWEIKKSKSKAKKSKTPSL